MRHSTLVTSIKNTYKMVLCTSSSEEQRGKLARQVKQQFLQLPPLSYQNQETKLNDKSALGTVSKGSYTWKCVIEVSTHDQSQ